MPVLFTHNNSDIGEMAGLSLLSCRWGGGVFHPTYMTPQGRPLWTSLQCCARVHCCKRVRPKVVNSCQHQVVLTALLPEAALTLHSDLDTDDRTCFGQKSSDEHEGLLAAP